MNAQFSGWSCLLFLLNGLASPKKNANPAPTATPTARLSVAIPSTIPAPMPFSLSTVQLADLVNTVPGIKAVHDIPMPKGRGFFFNRVWPAIWHFGPTKRFRGAYTLLEFG